jgi:hypothetical protein
MRLSLRKRNATLRSPKISRLREFTIPPAAYAASTAPSPAQSHRIRQTKHDSISNAKLRTRYIQN